MFKVFNALEELYLKSKESKTLECTDFLGNIIQPELFTEQYLN